jgi:hypothetical protein
MDKLEGLMVAIPLADGDGSTVEAVSLTEVAKRYHDHDRLVARIAQLEAALHKVEVVVKDSDVPAPDDVHDEEQWFNEAMKEADRVGDEIKKIVGGCFA